MISTFTLPGKPSLECPPDFVNRVGRDDVTTGKSLFGAR